MASRKPHAATPWTTSGVRPLARLHIVGTRDSVLSMSSGAGRLDLDAAAAFLETVPPGHWTSYGDIAVAAGRSSNAAQAIASWIGSKGHLLSHVYRVLNATGQINPAWTPAGPGLPADARDVRQRLEAEGLRFRTAAPTVRADGAPLAYE